MVKPTTKKTKAGRPQSDRLRPSISIRIDSELLEKLDEVAEKEKRSRSSQIEYLIEKYLNMK